MASDGISIELPTIIGTATCMPVTIAERRRAANDLPVPPLYALFLETWPRCCWAWSSTVAVTAFTRSLLSVSTIWLTVVSAESAQDAAEAIEAHPPEALPFPLPFFGGGAFQRLLSS